MPRSCPKCQSYNVRRSRMAIHDGAPSHVLRSPYRCSDCTEQFWVVSGKAYHVMGYALGFSLTLGALVAGLAAILAG